MTGGQGIRCGGGEGAWRDGERDVQTGKLSSLSCICLPTARGIDVMGGSKVDKGAVKMIGESGVTGGGEHEPSV